MFFKTNLHFHTGDDPQDPIEYNTLEGINKASELGFRALAITCHEKFIWSSEYREYASSKGVVLIPGIEINIGERKGEKRHLIVLNCDKDVEQIETFENLEEYKRERPQTFVLAPHPYYPSLHQRSSLMKYADKYAHLFDAVEHSWFYSEYLNKNQKAVELSKRKDLPLVSTSDTHFFDFLDTDYCVIEAEEETPESILNGIKQRRFENFTRPKRLFKEMFLTYGKFSLKRPHKKHESS
ncbi:MAG: PHP domain-containing protein [Candidatus Paceibacterota bacterium]